MEGGERWGINMKHIAKHDLILRVSCLLKVEDVHVLKKDEGHIHGLSESFLCSGLGRQNQILKHFIFRLHTPNTKSNRGKDYNCLPPPPKKKEEEEKEFYLQAPLKKYLPSFAQEDRHILLSDIFKVVLIFELSSFSDHLHF